MSDLPFVIHGPTGHALSGRVVVDGKSVLIFVDGWGPERVGEEHSGAIVALSVRLNKAGPRVEILTSSNYASQFIPDETCEFTALTAIARASANSK